MVGLLVVVASVRVDRRLSDVVLCFASKDCQKNSIFYVKHKLLIEVRI